MTPAVVVGAHTAALGVVRALGRHGIPVVVLHYRGQDMAQCSRYVARAIPVPAPDRDEAAFVDSLREVAERVGGGLLMPTADEAVVSVSRHRQALSRCFTVACPAWDVVELFIEKRRTYALAERLGVPCPRTVAPASIEEVLQYAEDAPFPCLVKPSEGHRFVATFGVKMFRVETRQELVARYEQATRAGCEVVLQEFIPGGDDAGVNYNSYWRDGAPLVEFTAAKLRGGPPAVGSPRVLQSRLVPEVFAPGRAMLAAVGFSGYACTEFKRDARDGRLKLMEVNVRHNLSTALAVRCGINFPLLQYRHLVHGVEPQAAGFEEGIFWIDLLRDLGYSLARRRAERYTLAEYLRPYLGRHLFATPRWEDPAPFLRECGALLARLARGRQSAAPPSAAEPFQVAHGAASA